MKKKTIKKAMEKKEAPLQSEPEPLLLRSQDLPLGWSSCRVPTAGHLAVTSFSEVGGTARPNTKKLIQSEEEAGERPTSPEE
eukprot:CAMPEP_0206473248 /NCGR_PEP_ID=MMETSP0324_2-20121206/32731_1 /ASSEMBLY_ACC=CAM_ASM_000836 /TAXON_ID=2866 /ORGANISM="Crypthecodinium cohnii, Strain Seligo" /LENGTH=81 /DNA_ID=CAMNT_0053948099 /DNA_START=156 /DNA_END=404 /DNA_ORIENTATION=+